MYSEYKTKALELKKVGDGQCVSLIVNNPNAYAEFLFPGIA